MKELEVHCVFNANAEPTIMVSGRKNDDCSPSIDSAVFNELFDVATSEKSDSKTAFKVSFGMVEELVVPRHSLPAEFRQDDSIDVDMAKVPLSFKRTVRSVFFTAIPAIKNELH